jgi:la-related protein 1
LYGLEKFWALLHYRKDKRGLEIRPDLAEILKNYQTLDDFQSAAHVRL